jgi:hypothetical protein
VSSETYSSGGIASASAWLPLLYDTYVFGLTLNRTLPSIRNKEAGHVVRTLFEDGLLYYRCAPGPPGTSSRAHQAYSAICTVNLVLTIMIIKSQEGVKNIAAQYAHLHVCSDFIAYEIIYALCIGLSFCESFKANHE